MSSELEQRAVRRIMARLSSTDPNEHWLWPGAKNDAGYGHTSLGRGRHTYVHRFIYEQLVGPIPPETPMLDHVKERCRFRECCNPAHLEPVTNRENSLRGDHAKVVIRRSGMCGRGIHPLEPRPGHPGQTWCRTCYNDRRRERRRLLKECS